MKGDWFILYSGELNQQVSDYFQLSGMLKFIKTIIFLFSHTDLFPFVFKEDLFHLDPLWLIK